MTMPADRERDRRSLQDLAKMAQMTPPPASVAPKSIAPGAMSRPGEATKDDSGIIDLAAASMADPGAALRAQTTQLASEGLFDDESIVAPAPVSQQPLSASASPLSAPPSSSLSAQLKQPLPTIPPAAPSSVPPQAIAKSVVAVPSAPASFASSPSLDASASFAKVPEKKKSNVIPLVIGGLVAAAAVAAGGLFLMKSHSAPVVVATTATPAEVNQRVNPVAAPVKAEPEPVAAADTTPAPEATVDPSALPTAQNGKAVAAPKGGVKVAAAKAGAKEPETKEESAKLSQKDLPTAPTGPAGALGDEMRKAVGDKAEQTQAAAASGPQFAAGSVPQKPSQGAVTGAIGAVLGQARACLGPDDPVSRAAIVFGSAGAVQSVNVSGGAAGKPAEACIKSALSAAKVAPFAEPTYTANITVRH